MSDAGVATCGWHEQFGSLVVLPEQEELSAQLVRLLSRYRGRALVTQSCCAVGEDAAGDAALAACHSVTPPTVVHAVAGGYALASSHMHHETSVHLVIRANFSSF